MRFQWPTAVLILAIIAVQCGSAAEDAGWDNGDVDGDLQRLGESLQSGAKAPGTDLAEQNEQLQGAIAAIQNGTPPSGMEGMMGGAPAEEEASAPGASAPAASSAQSESAAISKGIKMAMTSVKPLMDKYVATARALTDKYTKLQEDYKDVKAKLDAAPKEADILARIAAAVKEKEDDLRIKCDAEIKKQTDYIEHLKSGGGSSLAKVTAELEEAKAFEETSKADFKVQLKMAKTKAEANMELLHDQLRQMMIEQLQKRDRVLALKEEKRQKADIAAKQAAELEQKRAASDAADEDAAFQRAQEIKDKKNALEEVKTKSAASAEVKLLNRDQIMRKARTAMDAARHAARMARTFVRSTAQNVDDARLKAAKENAVQDVAALAKLRHHEDLAQDTVTSADEKKEKIAQFEFSAKDHLNAAETRQALARKRNRWSARHANTLRALAEKARDKAELLKSEAVRVARDTGLPAPKLVIPPAPATIDTSVAHTPSASEVRKAEAAVDSSEALETKQEEATEAEQEAEAEKVATPEKIEEKKADVEKELEKVGVTPEKEEPEEVIQATGMKPAGEEKSPDSSDEGHTAREAIRERTKRVAKEIKDEIDKTKKSAAVEAAGGKTKEDAEFAAEVSNGIAKAVDADNAEAQKQIKKDEKVALGLKPGESKKTAITKIQAAAAEAVLKSTLAQAKLAKAKMLRKQARRQLKKEGTAIPKQLKPAFLKPVEKKAEQAAKESAAAAKAAAATTEKVKEEVAEGKPVEMVWTWF